MWSITKGESLKDWFALNSDKMFSVETIKIFHIVDIKSK